MGLRIRTMGVIPLLMAACIDCSAQKAIIDSAVYNGWLSVGNPAISNDGKYAMYTTGTHFLSPVKRNTLTIQAVDGKWKTEIPDAQSAQFTEDSRMTIFTVPGDSLRIVFLGTSIQSAIPNVSSFHLVKNRRSPLLLYQLKDADKTLVLRNLANGKENSYRNVVANYPFADGEAVVLLCETQDTAGTRELHWVNVRSGKQTRFWQGIEVRNIILHEKKQQVAFVSAEGVWYYTTAMSHPVCLLAEGHAGFDTALHIGLIERFSREGDRLFISMQEIQQPVKNENAVEVWSYRDAQLYSQQQLSGTRGSSLFAVAIADRRLTRLTQPGERLTFPHFDEGSDTIAMLTAGELGGIGEQNWNRYSQPKRSLISTTNGARKRLPRSPDLLMDPQISPSLHYVVYFDPKPNAYFSYDITSGKLKNISALMPTAVGSDQNGHSDNRPYGIAGWTHDDGILLYDQYDIWKIPLTKQERPVCITNGFGRTMHIELRIALGDEGRMILDREKLILTGLNKKTKDNGFFSIDISKPQNPELLSMGTFLYYAPQAVFLSAGEQPVKARHAEVYIVRRESATESPNYFVTKDFRTFKRLSNLHPEKNYNWYTAELHSWRSPDSTVLQGILYKPENFDAGKKYPVIVHYYDLVSDHLNEFKQPESSWGPIDIATYASNGYLVFCPDIHYHSGDPMQGTYDAIISAAKYLSQLSFVNPGKMGIQGHSWGGIQTNFLVTRTSLFAAACTSSGSADWISGYASTSHRSGENMQSLFEIGQSRMGGSLWENRANYIKNSAILFADQVTIPLLMMHTKEDENPTSFANAKEFFTGLRRLGKKVWMLVYSRGAHVLDGEESVDYTLRSMQFFDHYLKDKPAPKWMTRGIRAKMKGIDDGLELDHEIKTPGEGLLTEGEKKKVETLQLKQPVTITIE